MGENANYVSTRLLVAWGALMALFLSPGGEAWAQQHVQATRNSAIYSGPGQDFMEVDTAQKGEVFFEIERLEGWVRVELEAGEGWISGKALKATTREPTRVRAPQDTPFEMAEGGFGQVRVAMANVSLYSGPGPHTGVIRPASEGEIFDLSEPPSSSGWYKVKVGQADGYIMASGVELMGAGPPMAVPAPLPMPPMLAPQPDYQAPSLLGGEQARVIMQSAPLHSGPDHSYEVVRTALQGEVFTISDQREGWLAVTLPDGSQAWVLSQAMEMIGSQQMIEAPLLPSLSGGSVTVTMDAAPLYMGPGAHNEILLMVQRGEMMTRLPDSAEGWVKVRTSAGVEGWVMGGAVGQGGDGMVSSMPLPAASDSARKRSYALLDLEARLGFAMLSEQMMSWFWEEFQETYSISSSAFTFGVGLDFYFFRLLGLYGRYQAGFLQKIPLPYDSSIQLSTQFHVVDVGLKFRYYFKDDKGFWVGAQLGYELFLLSFQETKPSNAGFASTAFHSMDIGVSGQIPFTRSLGLRLNFDILAPMVVAETPFQSGTEASAYGLKAGGGVYFTFAKRYFLEARYILDYRRSVFNGPAVVNPADNDPNPGSIRWVGGDYAEKRNFGHMVDVLFMVQL